MDKAIERNWVVHYIGNKLSVPMDKSTAKKYLESDLDADYMVKFRGSDKGRRIYHSKMNSVLFCEVFTCQIREKVVY